MSAFQLESGPSSEPVVKSWKPPFREAFRLARRQMLAFGLFSLGGIATVVATLLWYHNGGNDFFQIPLFFGAGLLGVPVGQLVALTRLRTALAGIVWSVVGVSSLMLLAWLGPPEWIFIPWILFGLGFASGFLSLQHRWEMFAAFLPAMGWVGACIVILNEEGQVGEWKDNRISAWLPIPLLILLCFVLAFGAYLLQKQNFHLELWQLLGGAPSRRLVHKGRGTVTAGARAVWATLLIGGLLFLFTAALAPYLWRTGRGDGDGGDGDGETRPKEPGDDGDPFDMEGLKQALEEFAEGAKEKSTWLLPLIPAFLVERPLRRWLMLWHLRRPFWRKANTDRIDGLWRYLRVGLEDAGVQPLPHESVEETVARARAEGKLAPGLEEAAAIYARTRYGLGVRPGDRERLEALAQQGYRALRQPLTLWQRFKRAFARVE